MISTKLGGLDRFFFLLPAECKHLVTVTKFGKSLEGSLDHVGVVVGSHGLGENVFDADSFTNGAHSTTSNNTGSGRGWLEENLTTTEFCVDFVRDGSFVKLHLLEVLHGSTGSLLDALSDFISLAEAEADRTFGVTGDDESREAETTSTFNHLSTAVDENDFLDEFITFSVSWDFADEFTTRSATTATVTTATIVTTATATVITAAIVVVIRSATSSRCSSGIASRFSFAGRLGSFFVSCPLYTELKVRI